MNIFQKWRRGLQRIGIFIGIAILLYQVYKGYKGFENFSLSIDSILIFVCSILIIITAYTTQVFSYQLILKSLAVNIPFINLYLGYFITFVSRYIPGSVWGYMSRGEWLNQKYQVSIKESNTSSILEILLANLAVVMVGCLYVVVVGDDLIKLLGATLLISIPLISGKFLFFLFKINKEKPPIFLKIRKLLWNGNFKMTHWISALCVNIFSLLLTGIGLGFVYFSFTGFGSVFSITYLMTLSFSYCLSWFVGFIIFFLPSGIGARDLVLANLLSILMGTNYETGNAISIIFRFSMLASELLLVVGILFFQIIKTQKRNTLEK